ncbi:MAG: adenylate/guanylate cyclase domain-containing protein [Ekhidna sp.]
MKLSIKSNYLKALIRQFILWTLAFAFWTLMREFGQQIIRPNEFKPLTFIQQIRFHLALGVIAGFLFGSLEYLFEKYIYKRVSFGKTMLIGSISYLVSIAILVTLAFKTFSRIANIEFDWLFYQDFIFSKQMILLTVYIFLVGFLIDFFREVGKKFGPGNLWRMLRGEFYHPKEDRRIFMFLDLKSSTTIAEQLGHNKYSQLIQECFLDVSDLVIAHKAHIYQYVGDEIVLSWSIDEGLADLNCIRFYYSYRDLLERRRSHYESKFGLVPQFKAGLEMGNVMVAEVGEIKREIAYHGDVLNTAARIQACCNEFNRKVLISESLESALSEITDNEYELMGNIQLKGKSKNLKIYAVSDLAVN